MKTLNALILAIVFFGLSPQGQATSFSEYMRSIAQSNELSRSILHSSEVNQLRSNVEDIFNAAVSGDGGVYDGYTPEKLKSDYLDIVYSLYSEGFIKLKHLESFETNYNGLLKLRVPQGQDPVVFWKGKYINLFEKLFSQMQSEPSSCARGGENATVRKCCAGLVKLTANTKYSRGLVDPGKKRSGESCNKQSDCQSSLCIKSEFDKPGICSSIKSCFELQTLGGDCSGSRPYCGEGRCTNINKGNLGIGECSSMGKSCSANSECCSDKCSNNKCVPNLRCINCVGNGAKPAKDETCCPGHYLAPNGRCRIIFRPLVPVAPKKTSFIKTILSNLFISSAHANSENVCKGSNALTNAQRQMIEDKAAECRRKYKNSGSELSDCMRSVDDLQASFCLDGKKSIGDNEQNIFDAKREACVAQHPQGSTELKDCLEQVSKEENASKEGATGTNENRYENFKENYNIPTVTAKTYSDARKCIFNAFNDNWKASSNTERNAEIFLRSFEFTFSGSGTQDYWEEQGKGNIFKRANKVALALRKNRARLVERTSAIDKEMTCKCVAIFGPSQFDKEKQDYFNLNCKEEAAALRSKLGTDIDESRGQGGKVAGESNIDGSSINASSDLEKSKARIEEIDKGALGLSHEKLLIEYLDLRSKAQIERFVDDESLEDELNELSEFISNTDFEEVWKDEVADDQLNKHSPPGDSRLLYKWGFKYLGGLLAIILIVVLAVVGGLFTGFALLGILGGALAGILAGVLLGAFGGKGSPGVFDIKKVDGGKYNLLYKYDGFEKWYVGPKFSNNSSVSETRCDVFAKASTCLKSAYAFKDGNLRYLSSIPSEGHFIVDPKVPPFVDSSLISTKYMPIYNKTWVQIINETVNEGVEYLKSTKPSGKSKKGYTITKKSFSERDIMQEAIDKKYFVPYRGNFQAKDFSFRKAITDAAFKYAMCKDLTQGSCTLQGASPGEIGLGYLFESEEEAREWADYTYEMHYVYSSVTKDTYMGYPLLGADVYFQAVAYNMKLVGSLAASRAQNYAKASQLYQQDWDTRAKDYQSLGEAFIGEGRSSKNIKYSPAFFEAFSGLNFSGKTQIEGFDAKIDKSKKNGSFNASELAALAAGKRQVVRINKDIEEAEKFDSTVGKTPEGRRRLESMQQIGSGLFGSGQGGQGAGSGSASDVLGANFGLSGSQNGSSLVNGNDTDEIGSNVGSSSGDSSYYNGQNESFASFGGNNPYSTSTGSYGYDNRDGFGSDVGSGGLNSQQLKDQGMSTQAADDLVNALSKDESLNQKGTEDDNLFKVVSRAYKRNYSRVLIRSNDLSQKTREAAPEKMSDEQEAEIKALLED